MWVKNSFIKRLVSIKLSIISNIPIEMGVKNHQTYESCGVMVKNFFKNKLSKNYFLQKYKSTHLQNQYC